MAKLLRLQSEEQQAFGILEEGERLCPSPQLLVVLGYVLSAKGNSSRAEPVLLAAIEGDPFIAAEHYALARLLRSEGKLAESDQEMEASCRAKENEPQAPVLALKAK